MGYHPTVFEKNARPGGMMVYGIPSYKLEKDVIDAEIDVIRRLGAEIRCGVEVGKDVTLDQLRQQGYQAFYIAIGCQGGRKANIPGEDSPGVMSAVDFLRSVAGGEADPIQGRCIVVGGGNFWRGVKDGGGRMERTRADHMGMMATVMNALAVADVLEQKNVPVRVQTAVEMRAMAEPYIRARAVRHLEKGRVVIFGCGTGNPFFSTDTGAVLRAAEINADAILLAKNIDGVYSADPAKDPSAVKYDAITYDEVLARHLAVMDTTATSLSMDNHIPVQVFALKDPQNILRVVMGEPIGTIVKEEL